MTETIVQTYTMTAKMFPGSPVIDLVSRFLRNFETQWPNAFPEYGEYAFEHGSMSVQEDVRSQKLIVTLKLRTLVEEAAYNVTFLMKYFDPRRDDSVWLIQAVIIPPGQSANLDLGMLDQQGSYQNYGIHHD